VLAEHKYLQEARGAGEAQREGLAGDVEGLGVGLLGADGQGLRGPRADPRPGQPQQRVGVQRHGRVGRPVEVEDGQAQRGQAGREGGLRSTRWHAQLSEINNHHLRFSSVFIYTIGSLCSMGMRTAVIKRINKVII